MRKMASVVEITGVSPIEGADAIEAAHVNGWTVVTRKGEYQIGDLAVYVEIDAFLPRGNPAWEFLMARGVKTFDGVEGHVLRTIRLRKQLSQGLLLPVATLNAVNQENTELAFALVGDDVSERLGITKYEPPLPACLAGQARGLFLSNVPKTDQERVQNISEGKLGYWHHAGVQWEVTEKLEGSSMTVAIVDNEFHVCSRNLDLKETEDNTFWKVARAQRIEDLMREQGIFGVALQGELVGDGVQGNIYGIHGHDFFIFDAYDIAKGQYLLPAERRELVAHLGLKHAPVLDQAFNEPLSREGYLKLADGEATFRRGVAREGIVFKASNDPQLSFKAVSNAYLLKQK